MSHDPVQRQRDGASAPPAPGADASPAPAVAGATVPHLAGTEPTVHKDGPRVSPGVGAPPLAESTARTESLPLSAGSDPRQRFCHGCGGALDPDSGACPACAADEAPPDPLVGRNLDGRYHVRRQIGAGAMGAVYEVEHQRLRKRFAMKVIHGELAQVPEFVARFEREAHACSRLQHPNCISVTDFGHADSGELFLVMEFVDGQSMQELVAERPLPVGRALEITRQVLLGLQHAHGVGIIHRDIKPDNVMLVESADDTQHWSVKILDFGIAKAPLGLAAGQELTRAGVIFGTPEYMAPEQAMAGDVDARADLYAVGSMLWRALTGRHLFEAEGPVELITAKLTDPPPDLDQVVPGVFSADLQALVRRAVARSPSERFACADEMLAEVTRIQGSLGRGLAVDPRGSALRSIVARATRPFVGWYRDTPDWLERLRALATTRDGWVVAGSALTLLALVVGVGLLAGGDGGAEALAPAADSVGDGTGAAGPLSPTSSDRADDDDLEPVEQPTRLPPALKERMDRARGFLARGSCREATIDLKNLTTEYPKLARGHYLLGAAHAYCKRHQRALKAYARAIALDPGYRRDARVLEDATAMLGRRRLRMKALEFLAVKVGRPAMPKLVELASTARNRALRQRAVQLVEWRKAGEQIDRVSSLSLDLVQLPSSTSCEERAKIVSRLKELGDPRAIPALRKARDQRIRTGVFSTRAKNRCIRAAIIDAIKHLLAIKQERSKKGAQ